MEGACVHMCMCVCKYAFVAQLAHRYADMFVSLGDDESWFKMEPNKHVGFPSALHVYIIDDYNDNNDNNNKNNNDDDDDNNNDHNNKHNDGQLNKYKTTRKYSCP